VLDTEQMLTLTSPRSTLTNRIWQRTTPVLTGTSSVSGELLPGAVSERSLFAVRYRSQAFGELGGRVPRNWVRSDGARIEERAIGSQYAITGDTGDCRL
jgi:hypothetical protein